MAGNQTDNLLLLDLTTGLPRSPETGGTPDTIQLSVDFQLISGANVLVDGDLVVNGTTTTVHSEQVNISDNHLYLNADYTTTVGQTGGIVINVLPTATSDTVAAGGFTAGVAATSNPTVVTTGSATFAAGDLIQISGANNQANDGLFEVQSHVGTTLTIRGVGTVGATVDFVSNQFVTDATAGGDIRIVNVAVLRGTSSGTFEIAFDSSTSGIVFNTLSAQGVVDLQEAYEQGNTITTSAAEGNIIFTGTEDFVVTLSDVLVDTTASISLDADTDSNFTVDTGNLTLSTTGSGTVEITSAGLMDVNAGANLDVDVTGTMDFLSTGAFSIDGTGASNVSATSGSLTLSTLTSGTVDITSADDIQMTFETNNATAMVIDNGTSNFVTFDSTTGSLAVEVNQFLDIVGAGAGVTLTAGAVLVTGNVVRINSSGNAILADANTGTLLDGIVAGVASAGAAAASPAKIYTVAGSLIPILFAAAPAGASNGSLVFLSGTAGQGTLTPPILPGSIVYKLGILQGANGVTTTPDVLYQPEFIAQRP